MKVQKKRPFLWITIALAASVCSLCGGLSLFRNFEQDAEPQTIAATASELEQSNVWSDTSDAVTVSSPIGDTVLPTYFCTRDENIVFTENQDAFGLCWDFSSLKALEILYTVQKQEVYDFSEAWVAVCSKLESSLYTIGDGGYLATTYHVLNEYGVLMENDFPYEALLTTDDSNYNNLFNLYSTYANKNMMGNIASSTYSNYNVSNRAINLAAIKNQIKTNGAVCASVYMADDFDTATQEYTLYNNTSVTTNHGITLIGWDDSYSISDGETTVTGAWIALNSYGSDWGEGEDGGLFYVMYDDKTVGTNVLGYQFSAQTLCDVSVTSSNAAFANYYVNELKVGGDTSAVNAAQTKNIFSVGEDISLSYYATTKASYPSYNLNAYLVKDNTVLENLESSISSNRTLNLSLASDEVSSGLYYVKFEYDKENNGVADETYYHPIYILNGCNLDHVYIYTSNYKISNAYQTHNLNSNQSTIYGCTYNSTLSFLIYVGSYSKVVSATLVNVGGYSSSFLQTATTSAYSSGYYYVSFSNLTITGHTYNNAVRFTDIFGNTQTYNLVMYRLASSDKPTYLYFSTPNSSAQSNPKMVPIGPSFPNITLNALSADGMYFNGWFKNAAKTIALSGNNDDGYTATISDLTYTAGSNYRDLSQINSGMNPERYTVILFADLKADDFVFSDATIPSVEYRGELSYLFTASGGSGNYSYTVINSLPSGLSFSGNLLSGTPTSAGTYSILVMVTDTIRQQSLNATFALTVARLPIDYLIANQSGIYGQSLSSLSGNITSGEVLDGDQLGIVLSTSATSASNVGDYTISGTCSNSNYQVTFTNGVYTIIPAILQYTVTNYSGTYDGQPHSMTVTLTNGTTPIYYSLSTVYSLTKPTFQNNTNGSKTIYFKTNSGNYYEISGMATVTVAPRQLSVTWDDVELEYTGSVLKPQISFSGIVNNETVSYQLNADGVEIGEYLADVEIMDTNYLLTNYSHTYHIIKLSPTYTAPVFTDEILLTRSLTLANIALPDGFSWENPNTVLTDGSHTYYAVFTPTDTTHYNTERVGVTLTISAPVDIMFYVYVVLGIIGFLTLLALILKLAIRKKDKTSSVMVMPTHTTVTLSKPVDLPKPVNLPKPVTSPKPLDLPKPQPHMQTEKIQAAPTPTTPAPIPFQPRPNLPKQINIQELQKRLRELNKK